MAVTVRILAAVDSAAVNTATDQISVSTDDLAEGEAVFCWVNGDDSGVVAADVTPVQAGWFQIDTVNINSGVPDKIFHRPAIEGTPPASYQFNVGGDFGTCILYAIHGSAGVPTFDVGDLAVTSGTSLVAPSVNIANDNSAVIRGWSLSPRGSSGRSITEPAGGTVLVNDLNDDDFLIKSSKYFAGSAGSSGTSTATASHSHNASAFTAVFYEEASGPPEVTAVIPLELALAPVSARDSVVTAVIPLDLSAGPESSAQHDVAATLPLSLNLVPTVSVPGAVPEVMTVIPLSLGFVPTVEVIHQVSAEIPLGLGLPGITSTDYFVSAIIGLQLAIAAKTRDPLKPPSIWELVEEVTAATAWTRSLDDLPSVDG